MLPPWNNFLWSLLRFVVVRSDHNERLVRINLPLNPINFGLEVGRFGSISLILRWQKKEEGRHKKEEENYAQFRLYECWPSFLGHIFSACLLTVCLCGHSYEYLYRFGIEIWSYTLREYHVFQIACNMRMYSATIYYNSSFDLKKMGFSPYHLH